MTAMQTYQAAKERMRAALDEANAVVKSAFSDAAKALFEQHPEMQSFGWAQYTPYFNDGDPCEFSVHNDRDSISINGEDAYEIASDSGYSSGKRREKPAEELHPLYAAQQAAHEFLGQFDESDYETMFGDHCEITVKRDGTIDVEEYSHD